MKVEIGKTYLTEGGRKATVKQRNSQNILVAEIEGKGQSLGFNDHGVFLGDRFYYPNYDLVSEYKDETQPTPIAVREWGNISFDGKEETLDTSFTIEPHDMKIIGGYRIENVGSTPIYVSSERHKIEEKDDTQMFKVGDKVRQKSGADFYSGTDTANIVEIEGARMWTSNGCWSFADHLVLADTKPSSPVQSRKTLVPGEYSFVDVTYADAEGVWLIGLTANNYNAKELREAIRVLGEVADYLEGETK